MALLFVYGSLKRGFSANDFFSEQRFVAAAKTEPVYRMYDYGGFPGAVVVEEDGYAIEGEIWDVADPLFGQLDLYEAVAEGLYARGVARLAEPHQQLRNVVIYLYQRDVSKLPDVGPVWKREWDLG